MMIYTATAKTLNWIQQKAHAVLDQQVEKITNFVSQMPFYPDVTNCYQHPQYGQFLLEDTLETLLEKKDHLSISHEDQTLYLKSLNHSIQHSYPVKALNLVYTTIKEFKDYTFQYRVLVSIFLPYCSKQAPKQIPDLLKRIYFLISRIEKQQLLTLLPLLKIMLPKKYLPLYKRWKIKNFDTEFIKLLSSYETEALCQAVQNARANALSRKNGLSSPQSSPFIIAMLFFTLIPQLAQAVSAPFNSTEFWLAVKERRPQDLLEGRFDVLGQLIKQNWCSSNTTGNNPCQAPAQLIPNETTIVSKFYWTNIKIDFLSSVIFDQNFINGVTGNLQGNFTFSDSRVLNIEFGLCENTSLVFENSILSSWRTDGVWLNSQHSSFSFENCTVNHMAIFGNYVSTLKVKDSQLTNSHVGTSIGVGWQKPDLSILQVSNSDLQNIQINAKISNLQISNTTLLDSSIGNIISEGSVKNSTFDTFDFNGKWVKGAIETSSIKKSRINSEFSFNISNNPIVELTIGQSAAVRNNRFENISVLKLTSQIDSYVAHFGFQFYHCLFQNINEAIFYFSKTNMANPILKNITLKGVWAEGGIGDGSFCDNNEDKFQTSILVAEHTVIDFFKFSHVLGGCLPWGSSAAKVKQWFERSGVKFGKNVTFINYPTLPQNSLKSHLLVAGSILGGVGGIALTIWVVVALCEKRSRPHQTLNEPIELEETEKI